MQILNSNDVISTESVRLADLSNHILINSVPYNKITNAPIPFSIINMNRKNYFACGTGIQCFSNKNTVSVSSPSTNDISCMYGNSTIKTCQNTLVDNINSNITYVFPSCDYKELPLTYTNPNDENYIGYRFYKIVETENGNFVQSSSYIDNTTTYYQNSSTYYYHTGVNCEYMTQTNTHVFCLISGWLGTRSSTEYSIQYILKINKETLNIEKCCLSTDSNVSSVLNNESYANTNSGCYNTITVLEQRQEGLVLLGYTVSYANNSIDILLKPLFFSFETNTLTLIECIGDELPYGYSTRSSLSPTVSSSVKTLSKICKPSQSLENVEQNIIYTYMFDTNNAMGTAGPVIDSLYYITYSKNNPMQMTFKRMNIVFPAEANISSLPYDATYQNIYSYYDEQDHFVYKTLCANYDGKEYVHLIFTGTEHAPINSRGIYTFEINEEHSTATFVSFYPALGGALTETMLLSEDRRQLCLITPVSYHFLKFNLDSKSWLETLNIQSVVKSMIKTNDNKIYAILGNNSIICQDLNGAVILDFNFEKQFYEYSGSDINSYITIWAKNSEDEYVTSNIKLTIIGNCIWQANGSQTLETTTSAEGPINIPFTIKGQTSINVSVDAII